MKTISRIVAYLVFFVSFSHVPLSAQDIASTFQTEQNIHVVKDSRFAPRVQYGYGIAQGIELTMPNGLLLGLAGSVSILPDPPLADGVSYRGLTSLGGHLTIGYTKSSASTNDSGFGVIATARAEYARYRSTNLFFFYPAVDIAPTLTRSIDRAVGIRVGVPIRYSFRLDLEYHVTMGISFAFLL